MAVDETFLGGKLGESHERAKEVERMWEGRGGRVEFGVETNMVWFDLEAAEVGVEGFVEAGVREGVKLMGGRVVVHYQIGEEGVRRLGRVMDRVLGVGKKEAVDVNGKEEEEGVKKVAREISELEVE